MNKSSLPWKLCPVCVRPFTWRKKWRKDWDEVKYCSKRCAGHRHVASEMNVHNQHCGDVAG
ncbi:DUF2256 domain-containing protein [Shewanella waksmanii]|uniref:DUF2256 domain-containing protein n=1 Tax=Shewanella waksmanii TaxID=213783 RepID=UPI0004B64310|nr:DUF2256 domain-containing protein [Shewanella waksmanii]